MSDHGSKQYETTKKRHITIRPVSSRDSTNAPLTENDEHESMQSEIKQIHAELERLEARKAEVINQTNAEIKEAQRVWKEERQAYVDEARQEGYTDGFNQGLEHGREAYQQLIADANNAAEAAHHDYNKTLNESEEELLDLAVHIAEKILHKHLNERSESLMPLVASAIQSVKDKSNVALYLNPADYSLVSQKKDNLTDLVGKNTTLSVYADDTLGKGSCLIEHSFGRVDAGIDAQLQALRTTLQAIRMENDL